MWVLLFLRENERATIVRNPIVPIKDSRDPREEIVFQNVNASG